MNALQIASYVSNLAMLLCAWKLPRVRMYAGVLLASDLIRLALVHVEGSSLALYGIDGVLLMSTVIALGWCLENHVSPLVGLAIATVGFALCKVHGGDPVSVYMAGLCVAHVYTTVYPICSRKWRDHFDVEKLILIGLSAAGLAGTFVMGARGYWYLAQAGNIAANLLFCVLALMDRMNDDLQAS